MPSLLIRTKATEIPCYQKHQAFGHTFKHAQHYTSAINEMKLATLIKKRLNEHDAIIEKKKLIMVPPLPY
jgi:hypothetical protein